MPVHTVSAKHNYAKFNCVYFVFFVLAQILMNVLKIAISAVRMQIVQTQLEGISVTANLVTLETDSHAVSYVCVCVCVCMFILNPMTLHACKDIMHTGGSGVVATWGAYCDGSGVVATWGAYCGGSGVVATWGAYCDGSGVVATWGAYCGGSGVVATWGAYCDGSGVVATWGAYCGGSGVVATWGAYCGAWIRGGSYLGCLL